MIFSVALNIVFFLVNGFLSILPTGGDIPAEFAAGLLQVWNAFRGFSYILPIDAMVTCMAISFSWILFVFFWNLIHWILRKLPFLKMS